MNWKNEAVERLQTYPAAATAMENLSSEIRRLEALIQAPGSLRMDAPIHSAKSKEDWLLDNLVSLGLLRDRLRQTRDWLQATDRAMDVLNPEERSLIRRLFLERRTDTERVSQDSFSTKSSLYRMRNRALEKFALALYGPSN